MRTIKLLITLSCVVMIFTSWTQKSYSFEATSSASVKIKFLVGTTRGAWIDDLVFSVK